MLVAIGGAATAGPLEDAVAAYQRGDYATALRLWHPLAEQGDADAQFHLGVMYESGQGVLRNDAEAIKWYRKAAEQDDAVAQFNLGIMYAKGEGVSPEPRRGRTVVSPCRRSRFSRRAVQPRHDVCRGPGRVPRLCASAYVAEPSSLATSSFGERPTEHNRRRPRPRRVQNDAAPDSSRRRSWYLSGRSNTATWGDYAHFLKACASTKKRRSALPSCLTKFRRSQAICRARQSPAALAFMVSCLRIGARSPLVVR